MSYLIIHDCILWQVIGEGGRWQQNQGEALRFKTSEEAEEYCRKRKIDNYTLLLKFDDADSGPSRSTPIITLLTFSVSDSACALSTFCNTLTCVA